jgi:hypothetical protein
VEYFHPRRNAIHKTFHEIRDMLAVFKPGVLLSLLAAPALSEPLPFFTSQICEIIFIFVTFSWPFGEFWLPGGLPCFFLVSSKGC